MQLFRAQVNTFSAGLSPSFAELIAVDIRELLHTAYLLGSSIFSITEMGFYKVVTVSSCLLI